MTDASRANRAGATQREAYAQVTRFPALDGLRAIAVLLVVTVHAGKHGDFVLWRNIDGSQGVPIFFVLSGFLITSLLLREQAAHGVVSLRGFYVRRFMRLAPVYYVVLGVYLLLTQLGNSEATLARRADLLDKLPLFLLYLNEYATGSTTVFGHTWSLGIEEKFYLAWPTLAFVLLSTHRQRLAAAGSLMLGFWSLALASSGEYPFFGLSYGALLAGCLVALALHHEASFERLRVFGTRAVHHGVIIGFVILQLTPQLYTLRRTPVYALCVCALLISLQMRRTRWTHLLDTPVMRFIGQRSYSIYLVHVLGMNIVDRLPWFAAGSAFGALGAYATNVALSLGVAELLYRSVEGPCIRLGHRWSAAILATRGRAAPSA